MVCSQIYNLQVSKQREVILKEYDVKLTRQKRKFEKALKAVSSEADFTIDGDNIQVDIGRVSFLNCALRTRRMKNSFVEIALDKLQQTLYFDVGGYLISFLTHFLTRYVSLLTRLIWILTRLLWILTRLILRLFEVY